MNKKILLTAALAPLFMSAPQVVHAQSGEEARGGIQLEEIIVRARKREENLQDVPVVVSAFDARLLERNAVTNIDELADLIPGFQSQASGTASNLGTTVLRGISNGTTTVLGDQAVAINIDGVQIESPLGLRSSQFDLGQIDVLKGPQSLYFGKNSPAGVVSLTTADPTEDFYTKAQVGFETEAEEAKALLVFSGPISDTLGFRVAGQFTDFGGDIINTAPDAAQREIGTFDEFAVRGTLLWEPTENFSARLKTTVAERSGEQRTTLQKTFCGNPAATLDDCTVNGASIFGQFETVGANAFRPALQQDPFEEVDTLIASLNLDWKLGNGLILSSTTGYQDIEQAYIDSVLPRSTGELAVFGVNPVDNSLIFAPNEIIFGSEDGTDSFSQEIRLTSDYEGAFNFAVGVYYDDRTIFSNPTGTAIGPLAIPAIDQSVDAEAFSVFGQVNFDITDTLELSVGARYTDEEKSFVGSLAESFEVAPGFALPIGAPLTPGDPEFEADNTSPEITLTWQPTDNATFFASYKEGFKSGSFDSSPNGNITLLFQPLNIQFDNEEVDGFELGFKTILFDNQVRFNGAFYSYDYSDLQLSVILPGTVVPVTVNAAEASIDGFEFDALYSPRGIDGLTLSASANYNDAEYDDFLADCTNTQLFTGTCPFPAIDANGLPTGQQQLAGQPLNRAPEFSFNLGASYENALNNNLLYSLGVSLSYSDEFETDANNDPLGIQDSYTFVNANVGIRTVDNRWALDLIAKNLDDERVVFLSSTQPFTGGGPVQPDFFGSTSRGRQILLRLTYQFGN